VGWRFPSVVGGPGAAAQVSAHEAVREDADLDRDLRGVIDDRHAMCVRQGQHTEDLTDALRPRVGLNVPTHGTDVGAAVSSSELGKFYAVDPRLPRVACNPETGPAAGNCQNLEGHSQSYAPEFTFNAGLQYEFTLSDGATLTPRIDYAHIGESWTSIFNNPALGDQLEARNLVNLKLTYQVNDWTLSAYALNATDQTYIAAVNAGLRYAGAPRQIGLNLLRTF